MNQTPKLIRGLKTINNKTEINDPLIHLIQLYITNQRKHVRKRNKKDKFEKQSTKVLKSNKSNSVNTMLLQKHYPHI